MGGPEGLGDPLGAAGVDGVAVAVVCGGAYRRLGGTTVLARVAA